MINAISWYIASVFLGLLVYPIARSIFSRLPGKGLFFVKPLGLLLWGFIYWWLVTLGLLSNDLAGQFLALLILAGANLFIAKRAGLSTIWRELKESKRLILWSEVVFIVAFALMKILRAYNPDIINTEKFMEMAFINAIDRSPSFPPMDPWLSGYSISYYYFGYVLSVLMMRITATATQIGYNLVASYWYAMTALGAYGIVFSLLAKTRNRADSSPVPDWVYSSALLAPIILLVVSNWHGFFDMLHSRGLFYSQGESGLVSNFWTELNLRDLVEAPNRFSWYPMRGGGWTWWAASRTVIDQTLAGTPIEIIDEFPAFSFLLADIHPHILNMPFILLTIAMAFEALLGGWERSDKPSGGILSFDQLHFVAGLIALGGLSFINTWDFPFYLVLIACSILYYQYLRSGWKGRMWDFLIYSAVLGLGSILFYIPFFISFGSQAGGILPSFSFFTKSKYFWVMFGPLLVGILSYLVYRAVAVWDRKAVRLAAMITAAVLLLGLGFTVGVGALALQLPDLGVQVLSRLGAASAADAVKETIVNRLRDPFTLLTIGTLSFLSIGIVIHCNRTRLLSSDSEESNERSLNPETFFYFLVLLGAFFAVLPEFVFLRDQFSNRMNTIFKFYFQAWLLWSLAAAYALSVLVRRSRVFDKTGLAFLAVIFSLSLLAIFFGIYRNDAIYNQMNQDLGAIGTSLMDYLVIGIGLVFLVWTGLNLFRRKCAAALSVAILLGLAMGLIYPVVQVWNKTNAFYGPPRLDGMKGILSEDEVAAVNWLRRAPIGTMIEANNGGQYSNFNFPSTFSGMPSLLGWIGHESQWRGGSTEMGTRYKDIEIVYSSADWDRTVEILRRYNIRYLYLGNLEYSTYLVSEKKFQDHMDLAFEMGGVRIYEFPEMRNSGRP